ncbi:unnamed protein product, partial [Rotaria magnacalcarata]
MTHIRYIFLISVLIRADAAKRSAELPRLLIISLDGFRHDYLNQYEFPILNQFRHEGVQAT